MKITIAAFAAALLAAPTAGHAHFLLEYVEDPLISRPGDVPMSLVFWHPWSNGHVMAMAPPLEFFMIHRGEKTDLSDTLTAFTFHGASNSAAAFRATVPVKRSGDYVVATVPAPYYEASEDIYIQQISKVVLNRSGMPTDWDAPVGLPVEIVPLNKPYNVMAGSTFTGRVMADGAPVAGARIEVEHISALPIGDRAAAPVLAPPPGGAVVAISDSTGHFTFGIPRAGWWGFAALGAGPVTEHDGKTLSQDAVLWVHARDLE
jgi:cobalt/nickel transport protein